ncbi:MAG TPA: hypothetical protein VGF94_25520 [Kofleriaceae bacterium]
MRTALVFACVLIACKRGPSVDEAVAEVGAQVGAKLEVSKAIAAAVASVDGKVAYRGPPLQATDYQAHHTVFGNAVLVYATDLQRIDDVARAPDVSYRVAGSDALIDCYYAIRKRVAFSRASMTLDPIVSGKQPEAYCDSVIHADKLVVVVVHDGGAAMPGDALPGGDPGTYSGGGAADGALLVFDFGTGKYLGARTYHAAQSATVAYATKRGGNDTDRVFAQADALKSDLEQRISGAIRDALAGR